MSTHGPARASPAAPASASIGSGMGGDPLPPEPPARSVKYRSFRLTEMENRRSVASVSEEGDSAGSGIGSVGVARSHSGGTGSERAAGDAAVLHASSIGHIPPASSAHDSQLPLADSAPRRQDAPAAASPAPARLPPLPLPETLLPKPLESGGQAGIVASAPLASHATPPAHPSPGMAPHEPAQGFAVNSGESFASGVSPQASMSSRLAVDAGHSHPDSMHPPGSQPHSPPGGYLGLALPATLGRQSTEGTEGAGAPQRTSRSGSMEGFPGGGLPAQASGVSGSQGSLGPSSLSASLNAGAGHPNTSHPPLGGAAPGTHPGHAGPSHQTLPSTNASNSRHTLAPGPQTFPSAAGLPGGPGRASMSSERSVSFSARYAASPGRPRTQGGGLVRSASNAGTRPSLSFGPGTPLDRGASATAGGVHQPSLQLVSRPSNAGALSAAGMTPPVTPGGGLLPQTPSGQIRLESVTLFLTSRRRTQKARDKLKRQKSLKKARKPPGKDTVVSAGTVGWYMLMGIKEGARRHPPPDVAPLVTPLPSPTTPAPLPSPPIQPAPQHNFASLPRALTAQDFSAWHKYAIDDNDPGVGGEVVREYEWREEGRRKTSLGPGAFAGRTSHDGGPRPGGGSASASAAASSTGVVPSAPPPPVPAVSGTGSAQTSASSLPGVAGVPGRTVRALMRQNSEKMYDFKFKDYAPRVFADIRRRSGVSVDDYLASLTTPTTGGQLHLWESGSAGKSGSFFFFSEDGRYIIKTIHHSEHKVFYKGLKQYYQHMIRNPHTLINRIFGLHRVKLPYQKKVHFVVMENILPLTRDIEEMYDLKGSTWGRVTAPPILESNPRSVRKDQNWTNDARELVLNAEKREILMGQMARDVRYLASAGIMDYSLLVGISRRPDRWAQVRKFLEDGALREDVLPSDGLDRMDSMRSLGRHYPPAAINSIFRSDYCDGYRSAPHAPLPTPTTPLPSYVYHLGVIDIFTKYDAIKTLEHAFKSMYQNSKEISAVNPRFYGRRFVEFMGKEVCNGRDEDVARWIAAFEGKGKDVDVEGLVVEYLRAKRRRLGWADRDKERERLEREQRSAGGPADGPSHAPAGSKVVTAVERAGNGHVAENGHPLAGESR